MNLEQNLLLVIWVFSLLAILFGVPYGRRHSFVIAFITAQGLDWLAEILLLQYHVLSFPIREFPKASDMSISLMILYEPLCCAAYVIYEPRKSWPIRALYLAFWVNVMTWTDIAISHFSQLQDHKSYYWLVAELVFGAELVVTNAVVRWFFSNSSLLRRNRGAV
ncbi:CBO0543 family protein [Cohnella candidum]|uniref:Uncharacterized protein n=1 Tax=Cohnella candidum TaxID=2674991 RepID=A0A3G3K323_9BACL|nr:CBO0543 family protein [Cohnella candidum]AYQ74457.1 hypothetical protein EAV92_18895 [Cohnella candidum]